MKRFLLIVSIFMLAAPAFGQRVGGYGRNSNNIKPRSTPCNCVCNPETTLNSNEQGELLYLLEQIKLAGNLYGVFAESWDHPIFQKATVAKRQHQTSLLSLLQCYTIDTSSYEALPAGDYANSQLDDLYQSLVTQGASSLNDALEASGLVEEETIGNIAKLATTTTNDSLSCRLANLKRGTAKQLRSFARVLGSLGETYSAQSLSAEEVSAILNGQSQGKKANKIKRRQNNQSKSRARQQNGEGNHRQLRLRTS